MSIFAAMATGVSGLAGQSKKFQVISDNIANLSTNGYKATRMDFLSLVTETISQNDYTSGAVIGKPKRDPSVQGPITPTGKPTDMAISGNGFFAVKESPDATEMVFTRAGSFQVDPLGYLRNSAGRYLMGFPADADGMVSGATESDLRPVNVSGVTAAASPTSEISITANLPADPVVAANGADREAPATGAVDDGFTTPANIYDSLGNAHRIDLIWRKSATGWTLTGENPKLGGVQSGTITGDLATGVPITFDGNGMPVFTDPAARRVSFSVNWADNLSMATTSDLQLEIGGMTQLGNNFEIAQIRSDGSGVGRLSSIEISEGGMLMMSFTNGLQRPAFMVPLATFTSPSNLGETSGNCYKATVFSGTFTLSRPDAGGAGTVVASSLEGSNVDLAAQMTDMIVAQNAYSANVKSITTADEMLRELNRLKG